MYIDVYCITKNNLAFPFQQVKALSSAFFQQQGFTYVQVTNEAKQ